MKKYPKLRYPGEKETEGLFAEGTVYAQEKLDGANFRFMLEEHLDEEYHTEDRDFVFGSRNVVFKNPKDENKQFSHAIEYVRENIKPRWIQLLEDGVDQPVVLFGEAMHPHTLEYDWDDAPSVVLFDIWKCEDEEWLHPNQVRAACQVMEFPHAPFVDVLDCEELDGYEFEAPQSAYGDVKAEGLALKNPDTGVRGKWVREDFKESAKETFGKAKKHQDYGAEKLSYQYITNQRIRKNAHKLIDEGEWDGLQMEMMEDLPEKVIRDMAEEEAGNVFMEENWEIDTAEFRSITSSRCAKVLKKMINEQAFA